MTNQEFSDLFDIFYNNISSNLAPGLNEHEKSVFLTTALNEILKAYFDPTSNKLLLGYDNSPIRQIDFSNITEVYLIPNDKNTTLLSAIFDKKENTRSIIMPTNTLAIINEEAIVTRDNKDKVLIGVPINYILYLTISKKPFNRPLKNQCWRLILNNQDNKADIIIGPNDTLKSYTIRYVKKPRPIILEEYDDFETSTCELDESLHYDILKRAVELAKAAYMDMNLQGVNVAQAYLLGQSATNIGVVTNKQ